MKILSVIPARSGSKGIPNKNIRLINGHPLVYYAIKNALNSQYITDVIVSTDSDIIRVIANQMGCKVKMREESLCKDNVTLDAVVYDASKDYDCDYVITMQPTSPTLNVKTLDNAIKYTIKNEFDTVISVINSPHLSWKKENNVIVKNYEKRLNRQYLPANYVETGAFIISKKNVVTEVTRIGNKVSVFEINETEAIDIDGFNDLYVVNNIFKSKKIAIYVNGNNNRGTGHIYRALEIADEFYVKPDIYYDINQTDVKIFGNTTHNLKPVNGIAELFEVLKKEKYDIFINDILTTSIDYMIGLKSVMPPDSKIINFEDDGEGAAKADIVFNALYTDNKSPNVYSGEKYYIAAKLFLMYEPIDIKDEVKTVFISFGGADPQNYTDRILKLIIKEKYRKVNFVIALGRAKYNIEQLLEYNKYKNIKVLYDVNNMPELMSTCDVAMTSRGRTAYELAMLGIPSIILSQNKREEEHGFISNENGYMYLGINPSDYVIESTLDMYITMPKNDRDNLHNILLKHDLKNGRKRVISIIENL